jgi:hypothetical protein
MCPACVAAMGLYVAGGLSAGAGVTFIAGRLSRRQREATSLDSRLRGNDNTVDTKGDEHGASKDRIEG